MSRVALVACAKSKQAQPTPAAELYESPWFRKARAFARAVSDRWYILSAKHGLLLPTEVTPPYNETLSDFSADRRRKWARQVLKKLEGVLSDNDEVLIIAGQRYREYLIEPLRCRVESIHIPMKGMGIGEQLQFLNEQIGQLEIEE